MDKGGSNEAFDALVSSEREGLFRFLFWSLGDREDSLDALQETLLRAFKGFDALRDPKSARNWLYVIASNVAKRALGRRSRTPRTLGAAPLEDARITLHSAPEPSPDAWLESRETRASLVAALALLEPELREPLLLFVVSGMNYQEIAKATGSPIGTVSNRIHMARQRLADGLRQRP